MKEITIQTKSPMTADDLLQQFGIFLKGGGKGTESEYEKDKHGNYKARCMGNLEYAKFAIKNQGYSFIKIMEQ